MQPRECIRQLKTYVPGAKHKGLVTLASNENPLGPSPLAVEAMKRALDDSSIYPDMLCAALKKKLAQKFRLRESQITVGNGSDDVMVAAAASFVRPGDTALTFRPTFSVYGYATRLFDGKLESVPMSLDQGKLPVDEILDQAQKTKPRMVFLCSPNNPTGTYASKEDMAKLMKGLPDECLTVLDEAYAEFATTDDFPDPGELLSAYPNLLILRTFSKAYGLAGLRVGYGLTSPAIAVSLEKARQPFNVNRLGQIAAIAALDDEAFLRNTLEATKTGREYLCRELRRMGVRFLPSQANFIFVETGVDSQRLFEILKEKGVIIRPLTSFGCPQAIRASVGTMEQNRTFVRVFEEALVAASA